MPYTAANEYLEEEHDHVQLSRGRRSEGIGRGHCNEEFTVDFYWDDDVEMWALEIQRDGSTSVAHFWTYEEGLSVYEGT